MKFHHLVFASMWTDMPEALRLALVILGPVSLLIAGMLWHINRQQNPMELDWKRQRREAGKNRRSRSQR
ncbi:hypothetical protein [Synoicihabitans lomoniglobus]|uniref:Uncharacterized protein n=1 Tax=Synoicihabitans lomoniglobus TaxID=2909285 RepID=A0AAE9ZY62_9BACT|nr:hypothetical protein [Opitutaceae bacterium LMO-M01]WED65170.1 hypothetical protein PXH66_22765 [Opitutaceae bacterium LMO-M01]